jgi:hypothetical protein
VRRWSTLLIAGVALGSAAFAAAALFGCYKLRKRPEWYLSYRLRHTRLFQRTDFDTPMLRRKLVPPRPSYTGSCPDSEYEEQADTRRRWKRARRRRCCAAFLVLAGGIGAGAAFAYAAAGPAAESLWDSMLDQDVLLRPGTLRYQVATEVFNKGVANAPAGIYLAQSLADVVDAMRFVSASKVPLAVKSGGHSYEVPGTVLLCYDCTITVLVVLGLLH